MVVGEEWGGGDQPGLHFYPTLAVLLRIWPNELAIKWLTSYICIIVSLWTDILICATVKYTPIHTTKTTPPPPQKLLHNAGAGVCEDFALHPALCVCKPLVGIQPLWCFITGLCCTYLLWSLFAIETPLVRHESLSLSWGFHSNHSSVTHSDAFPQMVCWVHTVVSMKNRKGKGKGGLLKRKKRIGLSNLGIDHTKSVA